MFFSDLFKFLNNFYLKLKVLLPRISTINCIEEDILLLCCVGCIHWQSNSDRRNPHPCQFLNHDLCGTSLTRWQLSCPDWIPIIISIFSEKLLQKLFSAWQNWVLLLQGRSWEHNLWVYSPWCQPCSRPQETLQLFWITQFWENGGSCSSCYKSWNRNRSLFCFWTLSSKVDSLYITFLLSFNNEGFFLGTF